MQEGCMIRGRGILPVLSCERAWLDLRVMSYLLAFKAFGRARASGV